MWGVYIGMLLIVGNLTGWVFGYTTKVFPSPFEGQGPLSAGWSRHIMGSVGVTLAVLLLVYCSSPDLARAGDARGAYNPRLGAAGGHRVDWMLALGLGLAAAVGSVAGHDGRAPSVFLDPT
jgi:branched-chain amino acid transport system permease protein